MKRSTIVRLGLPALGLALFAGIATLRRRPPPAEPVPVPAVRHATAPIVPIPREHTFGPDSEPAAARPRAAAAADDAPPPSAFIPPPPPDGSSRARYPPDKNVPPGRLDASYEFIPTDESRAKSLTPAEVEQSMNSIRPHPDSGQPWVASALFEATFAGGEFAFQPRAGPAEATWRFRFRGAHDDRGPVALAADDPPGRAEANRFTYEHAGGVEERYIVTSRGVEQQFLLKQPLDVVGALRLSGRVETALRPPAGRSSRGVRYEAPDGSGVTYGAVTVIDAAGRRLAAPVDVAGDALGIIVDGAWLAAAAYPVLVDPLVGVDFVVGNDAVGVTPHNRIPHVAYSTTANLYMVVWEHEYEGAVPDFDILAQRVDKDGTLLGGAITVSNFGNDEREPCVAWDSLNDRFGVAFSLLWDPAGGTPNAYHLRMQTYTSAGALVDDTIDLTSQAPGADHKRRTEVAFDETNNRYLLVFDFEFSASDHDIWWARLTPALGLDDSGTVNAATNDERDPDVAWNSATPNSLIVWQVDFTTHWDVWGRTIDNAGTLGAKTAYGGTSGANETAGAVAANPDDSEYLVVFNDSNNINGRRVNAADGATVGGEFTVSNAAGTQTNPHVVYTRKDKEYLVVWEDGRGATVDVYGQRVYRDSRLLEDTSAANFAIKTGDAAQNNVRAALNRSTNADRSNAVLVVWGDGRIARTDVWGALVEGQVVNISTAPTRRFFSVQGAFDNLNGTTLTFANIVEIQSGETYEEQVTIAGIVTSAANTLTLRPQAGNNPAIDGTPFTDAVVVYVNNAAGYVTLTNNGQTFTIRDADRTDPAGNGHGVRIDTNNNTVTGLTVTNCEFTGILVFNGDNNTIAGNTCNNNGNGIQIEADSDANSITGNTCNTNTIGVDNRSGILVLATAGTTPDGNTLTGNTCNGNTFNGILFATLGTGAIASGTIGTTASGNTVTANGSEGILLEVDPASSGTISGITIEGNTAGTNFHGIASFQEGTGSISSLTIYNNDTDANLNVGIILDDTSGSTVYENDVTNQSGASDEGIIVQGAPSTGNTVRNNRVWNNYDGVRIPVGTGAGNVFRNNTFYNNSNFSFNDASAAGNQTLKSTIFSNSGVGDVNGSPTTSFNVTYNPADPTTAQPFFINVGAGTEDFHVQSEFGSFRNGGGGPFIDANTSTAIDAGDPFDAYGNETQPRGGAINGGAYGNHAEASRSGIAGTAQEGYIWPGTSGSTDWATGANWLGGIAPAGSSTAHILILNGAGSDPTYDEGAQTVGSLRIQAGATLTLAEGATLATLTVGIANGGNFIDNDGTIAPGNTDSDADGKLYVQGVSIDNDGTIAAASFGTGIDEDVRNVAGTTTIDNTGGTFNADLLVAAGTLRISPVLTTGGWVEVDGTLDVNGGNLTIGGTSTAVPPFALRIDGTLQMNSGTPTLDVNGPVFWNTLAVETVTVGNFNVAGDWTDSGGVFNIAAADANTVTFDGAGQTIAGNSTFRYVRFSNSGTKTLSTGTLRTSRTTAAPLADIDMTVAAGVTLSIPAGAAWVTDNSYGYQVAGTLDISGGTFTCEWFDGDGASNNDSWVAGSALTVSSGTFDADNAGYDGTFDPAAVTISGTGTVTVGRHLLGSGATLTMSAGTLQSNGRLTISSTTNLSGGTINVNASITDGLNVTGDMTTTPATGGTLNVGGVDDGTDGGLTDGIVLAADGVFFDVNIIATSFINNDSTAGRRLRARRDFSIAAAKTFSAQGFGMSVARHWTDEGTFSPGGNTVTFDGTAAQTIQKDSTADATETFGNVTIDNTGGGTITTAFTTNGDALSLTGNLTLSATNTGILDLDPTANAITHTVAGNYVQNGGTLAIDNGSSADRRLDIDGNFTFTAGSTDFLNRSEIAVEGDVFITGGTFDQPTDALFKMDGDATATGNVQDVTMTAPGATFGTLQTYNDEVTPKTVQLLTAVTTRKLKVGFGAGGSTADTTLDVNNQTIAATSTSNSPAVVQVVGNSATALGILLMDNASSVVDCAGRFEVNARGQVTMSLGEIRVERDWQETAATSVFQPTGGTVVFDGGLDSQIDEVQTTNHFFNLRLNKSVGAARLEFGPGIAGTASTIEIADLGSVDVDAGTLRLRGVAGGALATIAAVGATTFSFDLAGGTTFDGDWYGVTGPDAAGMVVHAETILAGIDNGTFSNVAAGGVYINLNPAASPPAVGDRDNIPVSFNNMTFNGAGGFSVRARRQTPDVLVTGGGALFGEDFDDEGAGETARSTTGRIRWDAAPVRRVADAVTFASLERALAHAGTVDGSRLRVLTRQPINTEGLSLSKDVAIENAVFWPRTGSAIDNGSGGGALADFDNFDDGSYSDGVPRTWTVGAGGWSVVADTGSPAIRDSDAVGATDDWIHTASTQTSGAWEFKFRFDFSGTSASQQLAFYIIAAGVTPGPNNNGYYVYVTPNSDAAEGNSRIQLRRRDGVTPVTILNQSWAVDTSQHTVRVTRTAGGLFELLLDGGSLGAVTDATYSTSDRILIRNVNGAWPAFATDNVFVDAIQTGGSSGGGDLRNCVIVRGGVDNTNLENCTVLDPGAGVPAVTASTTANCILETAGATALVGNNLNLNQSDADSHFVNFAQYDFHIKSGSLARNAGSVLTLAEDWEGQARPQEAVWDIGADEFRADVAGDIAPLPDAEAASNLGDVTDLWFVFRSGGRYQYVVNRGGSTGGLRDNMLVLMERTPVGGVMREVATFDAGYPIMGMTYAVIDSFGSNTEVRVMLLVDTDADGYADGVMAVIDTLNPGHAAFPAPATWPLAFDATTDSISFMPQNDANKASWYRGTDWSGLGPNPYGSIYADNSFQSGAIAGVHRIPSAGGGRMAHVVYRKIAADGADPQPPGAADARRWHKRLFTVSNGVLYKINADPSDNVDDPALNEQYAEEIWRYTTHAFEWRGPMWMQPNMPEELWVPVSNDAATNLSCVKIDWNGYDDGSLPVVGWTMDGTSSNDESRYGVEMKLGGLPGGENTFVFMAASDGNMVASVKTNMGVGTKYWTTGALSGRISSPPVRPLPVFRKYLFVGAGDRIEKIADDSALPNNDPLNGVQAWAPGSSDGDATTGYGVIASNVRYVTDGEVRLFWGTARGFAASFQVNLDSTPGGGAERFDAGFPYAMANDEVNRVVESYDGPASGWSIVFVSRSGRLLKFYTQ